MRRLPLVPLLAACGSDQSSASPTTVAVEDHFHDAFRIFVCDSFVDRAALRDEQPDVSGIHGQGDGLAHVHPFTDGSVTLPNGRRAGPRTRCTEGGAPVEVRLWVDGERVGGDPAAYRLRPDQATVLAVVPPRTGVPALPWATQQATDLGS